MSKPIGGNRFFLAVLRSGRVQRNRDCRGVAGVLLSRGSSCRIQEALEQELTALRIAEKEIDGVRGREIVDVAEERGSYGLVVFRALGFYAIEVVRAKRIVTSGSKHATTMAAGIDVLTSLIELGIDRDWIWVRHGKTFLK